MTDSQLDSDQELPFLQAAPFHFTGLMRIFNNRFAAPSKGMAYKTKKVSGILSIEIFTVYILSLGKQVQNRAQLFVRNIQFFVYVGVDL